MKATDATLIELARKAGVRPPHLFHLYHYRRQMKDAFSAEGFATFACMDLRHVTAMLEVLGEQVATTRKFRSVAERSQLPEGWTMPEEWLLIGREKRFWTLDVCRTEAEKFYTWHRMKGTSNADWKAAWRNWIDGSRRENGSVQQAAGQFESEDARRAYLERLR